MEFFSRKPLPTGITFHPYEEKNRHYLHEGARVALVSMVWLYLEGGGKYKFPIEVHHLDDQIQVRSLKYNLNIVEKRGLKLVREEDQEVEIYNIGSINRSWQSYGEDLWRYLDSMADSHVSVEIAFVKEGDNERIEWGVRRTSSCGLGCCGGYWTGLGRIKGWSLDRKQKKQISKRIMQNT